MSEKDQKPQSLPKIHDEGDTIFDALDNRDLDAIDAECRGLDLVQPLAHYWLDPETAEPSYTLSKAGIEEAGRLAGGVDCPKIGLTVDRDDDFWHSEQEGLSLTSKLRRTGSASAKIVGKWNKPDRFGRRKAVNLAQRNAISALLTMRQRAEMIQHAIDIGSVELIDPPWKGKKEDDRSSKGDRPPAGTAPTTRSSRRPEPTTSTPTKEEALDYFHGITNDIMADARGTVTAEDRKDLIRAICRRATTTRHNSGETMSLDTIVGVIRRIERDHDAVVEFLRGDEWEAWLGFGRPETQPVGETSETEALSGPSQDARTAHDEAVLETPECVSHGDDTVPPADDDQERAIAADAEIRATEAGEDDAGAEPPPPEDLEPEPEEPETRESAVAACELAIAAVFEAAPVEGIGNSIRDRGEVVKQVRQAMRKAIIRAGVKDGRERLEELSVAELSALAAMIEVDTRAITRWLTSGRYLTSKAPKPEEQTDLNPRRSTTTHEVQP